VAHGLRLAPDIEFARKRIWQIGQPLVWLTVGVLASYVYIFGPAFFVPALPGIPPLPVPLFPPQAIMLAVLLLTPRSRWWLYLLVYYALQIVLGSYTGLPVWYAAQTNVANVLEPLIGAYLITRLLKLPVRFDRLRDLEVYVGCVVAGSVVGATWGAIVRFTAGREFWPSWTGWFLADVLASLILAPAILLWADAGWRGLRAPTRARTIEAIALSVTAIVGGVLVFGSNVAQPDTATALLYVPIAVILWAAVRFGPRGTVTVLAMTTVLAIAGAARDLGPFISQSTSANVFTLQAFLFAVGLPMLCLASLVQERGSAQEALRESEQRYRTVVGNFPHASVLLFGRDLRHTFADGPGLAELGLSPASVEGRTLPEAFDADLADDLAPLYAAALAGNASSAEFTHAGGTFHTQALPLHDESQELGMVIMQEITEQRQAKLLAELDRTRTIFFANVSHELRTPLTLLLGPLEAALASAESAEQRAQLELAHRNAQRLLKLTNALLDFARIEAGRVDAIFELTDLPTLTADIAGAFRSAIEMTGLRLIVDCPPQPPDVEVYVDPDLWEKVVLNLLSNALKFTFAGEIEVALHVVNAGRDIELRVRDTGVGIPPDELPRLFERFYRVRNQRSRTQEGSGIGLALVQEVIKVHGGTIVARSVVGSGSTFVVTLPTGRAALPPERVRTYRQLESAKSGAHVFVDEAIGWSVDGSDATAPSAAQPVAATTLQPTSTSKPRILVVDDNAEMRTYLARLLAPDHTVRTVADSQLALNAIAADPPDLVIADVMLPGVSGIDLVRVIRGDPHTYAIPIVLLSARAGEEARVAGLGAGADDYLGKPFAARELLARVGAHLALQRQRQQSLELERRARAEAELARHIAERASARAEAVQTVTSALARAMTYAEVGQAVIQHALPVVAAATGKLLLRSQAGDVLESAAAMGYSEEVEREYEQMSLDTESPGAQVVRTGEPIWIESARSVASRFPYWSARPTGSRSLAVLPLVADQRTIGALIIGFPIERGFDTDDRAFLNTLAYQCSAAVHRVQLYQSARVSREQAEAALLARDDFLRTMAHDLKTPLTSLVWHAQVLARMERNTKPAESTELSSTSAVVASAQELMANIDELRDLVSLQHGANLRLNREPFDLVALVDESVGATSDSGQHGVRLVGDQGPLIIQADRVRLKRVLCNLLDNAFKYSPPGSEVVITIEPSEEHGRNGVLVHLQDQGAGIPVADLPFVFDRYRRGSNVRDSTAGEGIGLASARQLVESHGGHLSVWSQEGYGTTFSMWLPRA
jgi:signal transduction histidine kinase/DNA-binding response OmpR family regulator/integral membrane sensor domain MASE1